MQPLDILPNGATIISIQNGIVLAGHRFSNTTTEYVTWFFNKDTSGTNNGHYTTDFSQAYEDFLSRI